MTKEEFGKFAKDYTSEQFDQIKFDWNGKNVPEFDDPNDAFRMHLCEAIKDDFSGCPDQLILDLYAELSKSAKETFSVYNSFHLFANELLERGGAKYFDQYLEGAMQSMDTGLSSGRLDLSKDRISEILDHIKKEIDNNDPKQTEGYDYMLQRFEWLLSKK